MDSWHTPVSWTRLGNVAHDGRRMGIVKTSYNSARVALFLTGADGQVYSRLCTNVSDVPLADDEFIARTHQENAELRGPLLAKLACSSIIERCQ